MLAVDADGLPVDRIAVLELPAADRRVPRAGEPGKREQLRRVLAEPADDPERLLAAAPGGRSRRWPGCGPARRAARRSSAVTQSCAPGRPRRARAGCGVGHSARSAGGSRSVAQSAPRPSGRRARWCPSGRAGTARSARGRCCCRRGSAARTRRRARRRGRPAPASRRPRAARRAAAGSTRISPTCRSVADAPRISPAASTARRPGRWPPEQHRKPGHDQRLEPHVRHDHLLHLELVGVQQHRRDGQRRQPAEAAAAQQDQVEEPAMARPSRCWTAATVDRSPKNRMNLSGTL